MEHLLEGGAYSDLNVSDVTFSRRGCLFEARCLLQEIRYVCKLGFGYMNLTDLHARWKLWVACSFLIIFQFLHQFFVYDFFM